MKTVLWAGIAALASVVSGAAVATPRELATRAASPSDCSGYTASNVSRSSTGLTADLSLAGEACNVYGNDIDRLRLVVNYDSDARLHVKIEDAEQIAYQVPESVFPRPNSSSSAAANESALEFSIEESPFSFKVTRRSSGEVLFDSSAAPFIFEDQYIRLRTALPVDPNIYGLGEHSDSLRLNTSNYTRTLWSRDAYGIPAGTNLYGNHPVYFDHRGENGTHGVFLLSSSGMDVKIDNTSEDGQYLEYNLLGGVVDLYFLAGSSPVEVSQQYSEVSGKSAMMPYWGFGLHQCRYGYRDYYAIAEVIYNYSMAGIPLETMWTDIDYMYERYIMTTDPDRFTLPRVRDIVDYLHERDQHYIVMVDPAVAYQTERENNLPYETFQRGRDEGLFVQKNGSIFQGVVWPGVTAFPDWFHPDTQKFWTEEFASFFDADEGVDIDGLWIDMNEAANFNYFDVEPNSTAKDRGLPPPRPGLRSAPRPIPGFPAEFQPNASSPYPPESQGYAPPWLAGDAAPNTKRDNAASPARKRDANLQTRQTSNSSDSVIGYPNRDLLGPPYQIDNENTVDPYGGLSNYTLDTDIRHYDGHLELDVHNLYGSMMSFASRTAMTSRRPGRRPLVITRSTFAGAGRQVGKWLGDNLSTWELYRQSIQGMLDFAALYQMPMVGSDVCGFGGNTTETLCARWASLGAFNPFYRNHNGDSSIPQEFFLWETVASSAKNAIDIRYRLLDYIYTAMYRQNQTGTPMMQPMFFAYPNDTNTFALDLQFFYGDALLISPVTEENSTSVDVYLPDDLFYDFATYLPVQGNGSNVTLDNVDFDQIPIHIKSGSIIPMRNASGNTTTEVRKQPFHILIAPDAAGKASGSLYLDDGDSEVQEAISEIEMSFADNVLNVTGSFDYSNDDEGTSVVRLTLLGVQEEDFGSVPVLNFGTGGASTFVAEDNWHYYAESQSAEATTVIPLNDVFNVKF